MKENPHQRKKQPEQVRRALLDCAARIAAHRGFSELTVQAVAQAAGVTKGGLFHHFPSKQALVQAVHDEVLQQLNARILAHLASGDVGHGCFTRAYVRAILVDLAPADADPWAALPLCMLADGQGQQTWAAWMRSQLQRHQATDGSPSLEVLRLAADGAWLAVMTHSTSALLHQPAQLLQRLDRLSRMQAD